MSIAANPSLAATLGIAAFVAWRMVSRVRRMIGRQRLSSVRPWLSAVLFPLLAVLLFFTVVGSPWAMTALLGGCGLGVALGFYGLRLTRFEATADGLFYTPNPYLGVALSLLLIVRLAWRFLQLHAIGTPIGVPPLDFGRSPLTLSIFGMLAGYYASYAAGLLRWKAGVASA